MALNSHANRLRPRPVKPAGKATRDSQTPDLFQPAEANLLPVAERPLARRDFAQLTHLDDRIATFELRRSAKSHTRSYRETAKGDIFDMVRKLDAAWQGPRPEQFTLTMRVDQLEQLQAQARRATDPEAQAALKAQCTELIEQLGSKLRRYQKIMMQHPIWELADGSPKPPAPEMQAGHSIVDRVGRDINAMRTSVQPKHPPFAPGDDVQLDKIDGGQYFMLARRLLEAVTDDHKNKRYAVDHLPKVMGKASEVRTKLAVYELAKDVRRLVRDAHNHPSPMAQQHREAEMNLLLQQFENRVPPHRWSEPIAAAVEYLREAPTPEAWGEAKKMLHADALNFMLGGEKRMGILKQVRGAFCDDKDRLRQIKNEALRDGRHFDNPLAQPSAVLNVCYDASWALAADQIGRFVSGNPGTLADPTIIGAAPSAGKAGQRLH